VDYPDIKENSMNSELTAVLSDVRALAEQRGWTPVVELADDLLSKKPGAAVVAAPADVDTTAFRRWMAETEPNLKVTVLPLEGLSQDPLPAITADKVVAVFQCGTLLATDAAEAIVRAFFSRPAPSYAIVLSGAERIDSAEDLDLIERGAWRLLVPGPKPDWDQQDLLEHECYLWSAIGPISFLKPRVQRDMNALAAWLHNPMASANDLARVQMLYMLDLAEEFAYRSEAPAPGDTALWAQRLSHVRESLAQLRRRLIRRLDDDGSSIERQLTASLQTLEQDLLHNLRPYLQQRLPQSVSSMNAELLKMIMVEYITASTERWRGQAEQLLLYRSAEIISETKVLLQGIDWSLVNELAARNGSEQTYPEALLRNMMSSSELHLLDTSGLEGSLPASLPRGTGFPSTMRATVAGTLVGTGVLAVTTYVLGFGPIGLVAAGAAAVVSGGIVKGKLEREQSLSLTETHARSTITAVVREAISYIQEHTQQSFKPIREHIASELKALEAMLDRALQEVRHPADQAIPPNADRKRLDEYRRKVMPAERDSG
jgi:hypothetical protein